MLQSYRYIIITYGFDFLRVTSNNNNNQRLKIWKFQNIQTKFLRNCCEIEIEKSGLIDLKLT